MTNDDTPTRDGDDMPLPLTTCLMRHEAQEQLAAAQSTLARSTLAVERSLRLLHASSARGSR